MFEHRDICSMLPMLSWGHLLGQFPHLAKAEPSSSSTSPTLCAAPKLPHLLGVWNLLTFISRNWGKRKLKNFTTEFWRLQEQSGGRNPTTNSAWDLFWISPNIELCGSAVWSALHFLTGHLSTSCHPLEPSASFGKTQKEVWAQENGLNLGVCVSSVFFTTQTENSTGCAALKVFLLLCLGSSTAKCSCLGQETHLNSPGKCHLSNNSFKMLSMGCLMLWGQS